MKVIQASPVRIVSWGSEKINLGGRRIAVLKPTEFHVKDDGSVHDLPTVAIVMTDGGSVSVLGEITLTMLKPVLAELEAAEARQRAAMAAYTDLLKGQTAP